MIQPGELVIIRKAWELGVEEIAMQTIIQLDGDVVTRIQPKYAQEGNNILYKIHNQGIGVSVSFWKELVGIVKDLAMAFVSKKKPTK